MARVLELETLGARPSAGRKGVGRLGDLAGWEGRRRDDDEGPPSTRRGERVNNSLRGN